MPENTLLVLSFWILYICMWSPGRDLYLHARTILLVHLALCARVFVPFSPTLFLIMKTQGVRAFFLFLDFFLVRRAQKIAHLNPGEGRVNGLDYSLRRNGFADIDILLQKQKSRSIVTSGNAIKNYQYDVSTSLTDH